MIAEEVRDAALLMKAAHSGVVEVWKIVLKEVEAVGPDLLKKVKRYVRQSALYYTVPSLYFDVCIVVCVINIQMAFRMMCTPVAMGTGST